MTQYTANHTSLPFFTISSIHLHAKQPTINEARKPTAIGSSARRGDEVTIRPKLLVIDSIELLEFSPESITIKVVCSKGTYIRALARDIGEALGSGGHLTDLRRTRVGDVTVDNCMSVDSAVALIKEGPVLSLRYHGG